MIFSVFVYLTFLVSLVFCGRYQNYRIKFGIKEQIDTITNSYNKWLYLFHISSC